MEHNLKHFYIPEEQSIYLLSHQDAAKLKAWIKLCIRQLEKLGYGDIELIGNGAFGFVFGGTTVSGEALVFKFSRINLPQHVQDKLEEESYIQSLLDHPYIPKVIDYVRVGKQRILVMTRAPGEDLDRHSLRKGALTPRLIIKIAAQLNDLLKYLNEYRRGEHLSPIVHGDIKPSNLVFDDVTETVQLVDWGSSVFSQLDTHGQFISSNVMDMMSSDLQSSNAKLGDVYFIGDQQLNGGLSSPHFDEQGSVATLYALASGQGARFGYKVITPLSLGLPIEFSRVINAMMTPELNQANEAADYFRTHMSRLSHLVLPEIEEPEPSALLPVWVAETDRQIDTAVYSSRKSFLRQTPDVDVEIVNVEDEQLDKYYKNYLQGMGETEKAFVASVSRLGRYPLVGGLTVRWHPDGVHIESAFSLFDALMKRSFIQSLNNTVTLARALYREGTFKAVLYDARDTLHVDRRAESDPFHVPIGYRIPYSITPAPELSIDDKMHSYFEDGRDPDEHLELPTSIMAEIEALDAIHHTGCIIFEVLPTNLKIHNYYRLLDPTKEQEFKQRLLNLLAAVADIEGMGIGGFMKMPYKDTRYFAYRDQCAERFYPKNPRSHLPA